MAKKSSKPARRKIQKKADPVAEARRDLAAALRWAARLGFHEGTCNHFSLKVPGQEGRYLINPHGLHFSEITASPPTLVSPSSE